MDKKTRTLFLVDTGAEVSVLPPTKKDTRKRVQLSSYSSKQVHHPNVRTARILDLDFNLRRRFSHSFIIADVSCAIIGADFLHKGAYSRCMLNVPDVRCR